MTNKYQKYIYIYKPHNHYKFLEKVLFFVGGGGVHTCVFFPLLISQTMNKCSADISKFQDFFRVTLCITSLWTRITRDTFNILKAEEGHRSIGWPWHRGAVPIHAHHPRAPIMSSNRSPVKRQLLWSLWIFGTILFSCCRASSTSEILATAWVSIKLVCKPQWNFVTNPYTTTIKDISSIQKNN